METLAYIAMVVFVLWFSAELDKAQPTTQEPAVQVTEAIAEPQPEVQDPWEEPTNVIKFPALTFTSELRTFEAEPAAVDYNSMTIRELKAIASDRKLKGYSRMTKATLATALAA